MQCHLTSIGAFGEVQVWFALQVSLTYTSIHIQAVETGCLTKNHLVIECRHAQGPMGERCNLQRWLLSQGGGDHEFLLAGLPASMFAIYWDWICFNMHITACIKVLPLLFTAESFNRLPRRRRTQSRCRKNWRVCRKKCTDCRLDLFEVSDVTCPFR